jgi:exosortase/archaeosortase family protein
MHLTLLLRAGVASGDLIVAAAGWTLAVLVFASERGPGLPAQASAAGAGLLLAGFGILQCARMTITDAWFLKILAPLLFGGVLLACAGWRGVGRHWRAGALIVMVAAPEKCLPFFDYGGRLTIAHAGVAGFLLHCIGMDVAVLGNVITTHAGSVQVEEACSGMVLMMLLLKLALMLWLALRLRFWSGLLTCMGGLLAGFVTGTLRVCVLAAVVNTPWFATLHGETGMNLFPLIGFLMFAPFLLHAEEALEVLLRKAWRGWRTPAAARWPQVAVLALIATSWCFCLAAGNRLQPERFIPLARSCAAQGVTWGDATHVAVPDVLLKRRFNAVKEARLWKIESSGTNYIVLGCAIADAALGPNELVENPEIARFIESELTVGTGSDGSDANARLVTVGIDARGRTFLTTPGFNTAQRSTLSQSDTWKEWLLRGRPLKDCRYNLFLFVPGK